RAERLKTQISSEYTNFGLWEYDIATDICYQYKKLNGKYEDILDPIVHFYDTVMSWGIVHTEDRPIFKKFCEAMKAGEKEVGCDVRVISEFNDFVWFRYEGKTIFDDDGKPIKVVGRTLDVTQEKGGSVEASYARKDSLTKTHSHEVFREFVAEKRSGANCYKNAAFICVGVDDLGDVKTRLGADYSDYIQKTVAGILMGICATERDSAVTRVRDGEFLLYLGFGDMKTLDDTALRIVNTVRDHIYDGEPVTASVGISMFKNDKKSEDVYNEASVALADAVKNGGGRVSHYSLAMSVKHDPAPDINFEINVGSLSGGAAKVFNLIIRAFCSPKERQALIKEAFKAAGQSLGAAVIFVYDKGENGYERSVLYNLDDRPEEILPGLEISCSSEELSAVLGDGSSVRIHCADIQYDGLVLTNGAVCAECRATRYNGAVTKVFAIVFDVETELGEQDVQVIDVLENALTSMYNSYADGLADQSRRRLRTAIISNHRMEGFSIIPGKFIIDDIGDNAAEHYDLCKGDICYKKMRGLDAPCENCPAVLLDQKGTFFESSAQYFEKERRWLDVAASVDENLNGERRYVISSTDITDCLGRIQMTDQLTGLTTFNVFTAEALRLTAMQESTQGLYTIVINVADFARINEDKGYETGDAILVAMADLLQRCIGEGELLCRSEDSRFTALLRNATLNDFQSRMTLMLSGMQKQIYDKLQVHIYFLVGVCDMGEDPVGIMGAIDRAITAQKTIRDRAFYSESLVAYYDGVMREKIQERRYIESSMMEALANNEFRVYYQPKVNIETGKVVGAEALVRWIRANGDIISPGKFVPIFEENGFITEMDFAIYRHAVADIARWLRMDIEVPLISLNVSRRHLADEDFCNKFNNLVDGLGVPHEYIELEITESLLTENLNKLVDVATWFKDRGYRISIDDFGSGYSSLNLITMMPFDTLKIDGGFFLRNDLTDKNKKVITSVVSLAKSLNLETVSEGVETQTQVDFLKDLGCDMIQGFFYYKPMPGADFEQVISTQNKKQ
ncbi:MAG: EAL domain-containing protein, partial [Oscillospiraceae bacterium]|nr:EAL domain-containing protein [Oscillospiraceae bacterium]